VPSRQGRCSRRLRTLRPISTPSLPCDFTKTPSARWEWSQRFTDRAQLYGEVHNHRQHARRGTTTLPTQMRRDIRGVSEGLRYALSRDANTRWSGSAARGMAPVASQPTGRAAGAYGSLLNWQQPSFLWCFRLRTLLEAGAVRRSALPVGRFTTRGWLPQRCPLHRTRGRFVLGRPITRWSVRPDLVLAACDVAAGETPPLVVQPQRHPYANCPESQSVASSSKNWLHAALDRTSVDHSHAEPLR
jgi:hypothetical protein